MEIIIFDDIKFVEYLKTANEQPKMQRGRNCVLRSIAKVITNFEEYSEFCLRYASNALTGIEDVETTLEYYHCTYKAKNPIRFHPVIFSENDLHSISEIKNKYSRKINFALLFLFEYFNVQSLKVTANDLKKLINLTDTKSIKDVDFIPQIRPLYSNISKFLKRLKPMAYTYSFEDCNDKTKKIYFNEISFINCDTSNLHSLDILFSGIIKK